MRVVVSANLKRLLDHHYKHLANLTQRQRALAADCKVGFGTIQRICKAEVGASLDNLEAVADALHVQLYQLLLPSLDVRNPQIVQGATEAEQRLYRLWKRTGTLV